MKTLKEKQKNVLDTFAEKFHLKNKMQVPRVEKVVVSVGVGSFKDKKRFQLVEDRLAKITGQKAISRGAKKSIASFKTRTGDTVGYQVTLRGRRMHGFLEKLFRVAVPRMKDFRGISPKAIDEMGNLTVGIPEHTVFPETADEELKDVFGLGVSIVTTTGNPKMARAYFESLGVPFKREKTKVAQKI